jgi:parvulin-like peptidyl-prolyl isomerase
MKIKLITLIFVALCISAVALAQESDIIEEVIIKINDEVITRSEYEARLNKIITSARGQIPEEQIQARMPRLRKDTFNDMVNKKIMQIIVDRRGFKMPESYYQGMIDNLKKQTQARNDQEFLKALRDNGMSLEDIRSAAQQQYNNYMLFNYEVAKEIPDTESEIQTYYEENSDRYLIPAKIRISQIIFPVTEETKQNAIADAGQALSRIKAGEDFAEVYRSVTPQAAPDADGDIGFVQANSLREEMRTAIDNLQAGEVSEVVETPAALVIIKVTEKEEEKITPLEEIKEIVVNDMRMEIMKDGLDKLILKYKKEFFIETRSEEFAALYDPESTINR